MAQRISRAKSRLREAGTRFTLSGAEQLPDRVAATAQLLYPVFTEGHINGTAEAR
jgi:predicted RNA polymerase sigma factor